MVERLHDMRALLWLPLALVAGANVIYVVVDDLDQMLMQTTAATPLPKTKRLLVDEGATFTNAFAHVPICNPSRGGHASGQVFPQPKSDGRAPRDARGHG